MKKLNVYLGWDSREPLAYDVARCSILRHTEHDVRVIPLELKNLEHLLTRPIEFKDGKMWDPISGAHMSTEFAISRFCVPFLQKKGWAVFADSDIVCLDDIEKLFALRDDKFAVMVVKHDYTPAETTKMDGQVQSAYRRKNWSSVVLWNCSHESNKLLTVEGLNTTPGRDLHAFGWLEDGEIGELPSRWNHLVGINPSTEPASILHFTNGGPWLTGWKQGPGDDFWNAARQLIH